MSNYFLQKPLGNTVHDITLEQIQELREINQLDTELGNQMTQSTYRGESYFTGNYCRDGLYQDVLERDPLTAGTVFQYPHGVVIQQSQRRYFYRGENRQYKTSVSSLLRKLDNPGNEFRDRKKRELYRFVSDMRIGEFIQLLQCFEHVQKWTESDIIWEALAQHYGLETGWMDITSNFDVALFFANSTFENGKWRPLTKADTELHDYTKYGVIFHMPARVMNGRWLRNRVRFASITTDGEVVNAANVRNHLCGEPENLIYPIGFQPFMRCSMQDGYGIYMRTAHPLQEDPGFQKLRFRHDESLAATIFEEMEEGRKVYPYEGLTQAQHVIDKIRTLTTFSEKAFTYALRRSHDYRIVDADLCREELSQFKILQDGQEVPIKIEEQSSWRITKPRRRLIDDFYRTFSLLQTYGIKAMQRNTSKGTGLFEPWMLLEHEDSPGAVDFEPRSSAGCMDLEMMGNIGILSKIERNISTNYM